MKKPKKNYRCNIRNASETYNHIHDAVHPDVTDQVDETLAVVNRLIESQISRIEEQLREQT